MGNLNLLKIKLSKMLQSISETQPLAGKFPEPKDLESGKALK